VQTHHQKVVKASLYLSNNNILKLSHQRFPGSPSLESERSPQKKISTTARNHSNGNLDHSGKISLKDLIEGKALASALQHKSKLQQQ